MPFPVAPIIWTAFSGLVFTRLGSWIAAALAAVGIGLAVQGVVFSGLTTYAQNAFSGLPSDIANWIAFLNIDKYMSLVISGYAGAGLKRVLLRKISA